MVMGSSHFLYSSSQDFLENIQEDIPLLFLSTYERYLCILIIFQRGDVWNFNRYWIYLSETFKELQNSRFLRSETLGGEGGGESSVPTFEDRRAQFCSYLLKYYLTRGTNDNATKRHLQVILQKWNLRKNKSKI